MTVETFPKTSPLQFALRSFPHSEGLIGLEHGVHDLRTIHTFRISNPPLSSVEEPAMCPPRTDMSINSNLPKSCSALSRASRISPL